MFCRPLNTTQEKSQFNMPKELLVEGLWWAKYTPAPWVNTAGVMPIIFAQSIMFIPSTISTFFADSDFSASIMRWFSFEHPVYWIFFGLMIVFFTYFYTAIAFDPIQVSSQMKQQGGFIPGVRPGKKTSEYMIIFYQKSLFKFYRIGYGRYFPLRANASNGRRI